MYYSMPYMPCHALSHARGNILPTLPHLTAQPWMSHTYSLHLSLIRLGASRHPKHPARSYAAGWSLEADTCKWSCQAGKGGIFSCLRGFADKQQSRFLLLPPLLHIVSSSLSLTPHLTSSQSIQTITVAHRCRTLNQLHQTPWPHLRSTARLPPPPSSAYVFFSSVV